jgi:hypothetical protein
MHATFKSLPNDPIELRAVSELMAAEIKAQAYQIGQLNKKLAAHRKARFGTKSETMDQLAFDLQEDTEIATASEAQKTAPETDADQDASAKRTHNRAPLPDHLEREEEILLPGDTCGDCGGVFKQLGEDGEALSAIGPRTMDERRAGIRPRPFCGETHCAATNDLHLLRDLCSGRTALAPDHAWASGAGSVGPCAGRQVLRSSAALSPVGNLCP